MSTNSLNKTFAGLAREIDKSDYLGSFKSAMALKDSHRRFPKDQEFKQALKVKNVYNFRCRNYLLTNLENHGRKEPVSVVNYTTEHILPQNSNLNPTWQDALGPNWKEVHERVLHTLGNLTLTGYNSEYSDHPFAEKRDMEGGFKESPLRLNKDIGQLEEWNEAEITKRAEVLADKAVAIWAFPTIPNSTMMKYQPSKIKGEGLSILDHKLQRFLQGNNMKLFDELRKRIMNLDTSVQMITRKQFIGFDTSSNFVGIVPYHAGLGIRLNVRADQIDDPEGLCKDISTIGHWGNGDLTLKEKVTTANQLDDIMALVWQAFELHYDEQ